MTHRSRRRHLLRVVAVGASILTWTLAAPSAGAHAALMSSEPSADSVVDAAPSEITMTFSEPVVALPGSVAVYGPDGDRVDNGSPETSDEGVAVITEVAARQRGSYTVSWRVTSDDGHTINGSWTFHVGERSGSAEAVDRSTPTSVGRAGWLGRVLFASGLIGVIGSAVVGGDRMARRSSIRRVTISAASFVVAGTFLILIARVAEATGQSLLGSISRSSGFVSAARSGQLDAGRGVLALLLLAAVLLLRSRRTNAVVGALAALIAVVAAMSGHAAVTGLPALSVTVDAAHFFAAGVWLGGLAIVLAATDDTISTERWSNLAAVSVVVLAITGVISGFFQVRVTQGLWETDYGRLLLLKVALVAVMAALGWVNRRHLEQLALRAQSAIRRVGAEVGVGVAVLAVTGLLVATVPAADAVSEPFSGSTQIGSLDATFTVDPGKVGDNQMHIFFTSPDGGSASVDAAELTLTGPGVEPARVPLIPITPSHFAVVQAPLGRPGNWTAELVAVVKGEPSSGSITIPVR